MMNSVELGDNAMELARLSCGLDTGLESVKNSETFWIASSISTATSEKPESLSPLHLQILSRRRPSGAPSRFEILLLR